MHKHSPTAETRCPVTPTSHTPSSLIKHKIWIAPSTYLHHDPIPLLEDVKVVILPLEFKPLKKKNLLQK